MNREPGRRRRRLSPEERVLWKGVTQSIAPLRPARTEDDAAAEPPAAAPLARKIPSPAPQRRVSQPPPLIPLERRLKKQLRRGARDVDARIDLHGMTRTRAHQALMHFLRRAHADGAALVLIITGKGSRSRDSGVFSEDGGERGVLKRQVPLWLALPECRDMVIGFDDAAIGHGGEGALYVRLRRRRG